MYRVLGSRSLLVPVLHSRESTQLCSGCFSSAASISLFSGCGRPSFWPSPCFGEEGLRSGECGRQSLQGSWKQSRERDMDFGGACDWRQNAFGSGRRRSAVGSGHHTRVLCSWQWRTTTRSSNHGRCGPDPRQWEAQREDLPGVTAEGQVVRSGGWRQEVSGSEVVCGSAGHNPRKVRATSAPPQDGTGVETEVVFHPLVCRDSRSCLCLV